MSSSLTVVCLSFLIGIFERPYYQFNFPDTPFQQFSDFSSCAWYMVITMTSVGYGDMVAVTPIGRGITICATILGALYLALMVALVT